MNKILPTLFTLILISSKNTHAMDSDKKELGKELHYAIKTYRQNSIIQKVETLIAQGADLNWEDDDGWTALFFTISLRNNGPLLNLLINARANINHADKLGATALGYAAMEDSLDKVTALIQAKAQIDHVDSEGTTALMTAVRYCNIKCISQLIAAGANLKIQDAIGKTAITYASAPFRSYEKLHTSEILIDAMQQRERTFQDQKHAIITFIGIRKKNGLLHQWHVSKDMARLIGQIWFGMIKHNHFDVTAEIKKMNNV